MEFFFPLSNSVDAPVFFFACAAPSKRSTISICRNIARRSRCSHPPSRVSRMQLFIAYLSLPLIKRTKERTKRESASPFVSYFFSRRSVNFFRFFSFFFLTHKTSPFSSLSLFSRREAAARVYTHRGSFAISVP